MTNGTVITEASSNSNSDYSLQLNRWLLKPIGAWPSSSSTTRLEKIVSFVLNIACYASLVLATIPSLLRMLLEDESVYLKVKSLGPVSHWIVSSINYTALLLHGRNIRQCVEHMEDDWRTVAKEMDRKTMMKNAKFGRYVAVSCAIFMQGGVLGFFFVTALNTVEVRVGNETRMLHELPCTVYKKLVNVDESRTNEIMLLVQFWASVIANSSTASIFSLAAVLAAHACGQLNVVMAWITDFVNESRKTDGFKGMGVIVERHLRTLK